MRVNTLLIVGAKHSITDAPLSVTIPGALYGSLSFNSSANRVGLGRSIIDASGVVSSWGTDNAYFSLGASHPLSANSDNGAVSVESSYALRKATPNASFSAEVG
jgi:hypothetical protein